MRCTHSLSMSEGRFLGTSSRPFLVQSAVVLSQEHSHGHLTSSVRPFKSSARAPGPRAVIINKHRTRYTFMAFAGVERCRRKKNGRKRHRSKKKKKKNWKRKTLRSHWPRRSGSRDVRPHRRGKKKIKKKKIIIIWYYIII